MPSTVEGDKDPFGCAFRCGTYSRLTAAQAFYTHTHRLRCPAYSPYVAPCLCVCLSISLSLSRTSFSGHSSNGMRPCIGARNTMHARIHASAPPPLWCTRAFLSIRPFLCPPSPLSRSYRTDALLCTLLSFLYFTHTHMHTPLSVLSVAPMEPSTWTCHSLAQFTRRKAHAFVSFYRYSPTCLPARPPHPPCVDSLLCVLHIGCLLRWMRNEDSATLLSTCNGASLFFCAWQRCGSGRSGLHSLTTRQRGSCSSAGGAC